MEMTLIQKITIWALPILFAITLHEVAHGWVASYFGDQTARLAGRLSLNPLKHVDPFGTIILPLVMLMVSNFIFGWAKAVPVDPRNMKNPRRDMAIVALAGPLANILMAFAWGGIAKIGILLIQSGNSWLGEPLKYMGGAGIMINVVLAVLNLIPLPPLDGGTILASFLRGRAAYWLHQMESYSFIILIVLLVSGILNKIMLPFILLMMNIINKVYGLF